MRPVHRSTLFANRVRELPLPMMTKLVAFTLWSYMDTGGRARPSMSALARGAGCSERTARRHVRELELLGLVRVYRSGGRVPNRYVASVNPDTAVAGSNPDTGVSVIGADNGSTRTPEAANPDTAVSSEGTEGKTSRSRAHARARESDEEFVARILRERGVE